MVRSLAQLLLMSARGRRAVTLFIAAQVLVPLALYLVRWFLMDGRGSLPFSWQMYSTLS